MAEYSKEKLYFLQLSKDFFKSYDITLIKDEKDGEKSLLFLLELMCESCSHNGYLRYSKEKPYTNKMLASITHTDLKIVNNAMRLFKKLNIVQLTEDKTIFIPKVEEMTTSKTKGSIAKAEQRKTHSGQEGDICPPYNKSVDDKSVESRDESLEEVKRKKMNDALALAQTYDYSSLTTSYSKNTYGVYLLLNSILELGGTLTDEQRAWRSAYLEQCIAIAKSSIKD